MAIFSMMFGASLLLIIDRAKANGMRPFTVHSRRNLALLLVGAAHAYLLWTGDVLFPYALCSFFVYLFRNRRPRTQLIVGLLMLVLGTLILLGGGLAPASQDTIDSSADFNPTEAMVEKELTIYRSDWPTQMGHRVLSALEMHLAVIPFYFFWRVSGMMLIGMALFRWGVLSAERSARFYGTLIAVAVAVGLPLVHYSVVYSEAHDWDYQKAFFLGGLFNYWGSLLVALGWIGLVMLLCRGAGAAQRFAPLAAVGRMAFTNYLMHTLICTTLFYGHGFGLFGKLDRIEQAGVVVAIWILQLIYSPLWLKHFRYGPAEWLWRAATYAKWPEMKIRASS